MRYPLDDYVNAAFVERQADETWAGALLSFPEVAARGATPEACREALRAALVAWVIDALRYGFEELPALGAIDLNRHPRYGLEWAEPWEPLEMRQSRFYEDQLTRELTHAPTHPLYGVSVRAIGDRGDCADTLYQTLERPPRYAVVHLTAGHGRPDTRMYEGKEAIQDQLRADAEEVARWEREA
ncbi:MAG TPA: hypothetical protein VK610_03690 [Rhodothermales bacterium]|nr:hypothetical protein [Rhodothermales bacterium]